MIAFAILSILQIADIWTTWTVITKLGGRELNPILAPMFKHFGLVPTLVVLKGGMLALVYFYLLPLPWVIWAVAVAYAGVVLNNWWQIVICAGR